MKLAMKRFTSADVVENERADLTIRVIVRLN